MPRYATPLDYWMLGLRTTQMMAKAQVVIALRVLGMFGHWPVSPSETSRMVQEKGPAFIRAAGAATAAAMKGHRPDRIAGAALRPIGARTRSNARRLSTRKRK